MWTSVIDFVLDSISNIGYWWDWLTTPFKLGSISIAPIAIITSAGFTIVIGFWVVKLVISIL